jgi:hypothetical protein
MPFTPTEFFDVFRRYNEAVWPAQLLLVAASLMVVVLAFRPSSSAGRVSVLVLAMLWLWAGVIYHGAFFRQINPVAAVFGAVFVVQGVIFAWLGIRERPVTFRARRDPAGVAGGLMIVYALLLYPLIGLLAGHRYPAAPTFGVPCPTTIFTLGLLLWAEPPVPRPAVVIPVLWAVVATIGAVQLGVPEDFGLTIAAAIAAPVMLFSRRQRVLATPA